MFSQKLTLFGLASFLWICFLGFAQAQAQTSYQNVHTSKLTEQALSQNDQLTSGPLPLDLPVYENLEELMIHVEELHKRANDRNPTISQRAANEMEPLIRGIMHPRLALKDERYQTLSREFYQANLELREALKTRQRKTIDRAYQNQARSCTTCHEALRPEKEK